MPGHSQANIEGLVDTLTVGGPLAVSDTMPVVDMTNSIEKRFKRIGKAAIPYLIDAIDRDKRGIVGFIDVRASDIHLQVFNYTGITAAYMIEYLLSDSTGYQLFPLGVIVPRAHGEPVYHQLTLRDVKAVKKIYLAWWEAHKDESMEALQKNWRDGKRALIGSGFQWL